MNTSIQIFLKIRKVNTFQGDPTDISAKKEPLPLFQSSFGRQDDQP